MRYGSKTAVRPWRLGLLIGVAVAAVGLATLTRPLPQDPAYHQFADHRAILGVPLALVALMLALFPGHRPTRLLVAGLAVYAVGKLAELADTAIFALGGVISGHTVKHLLAAVAAGLLARWLAASGADPRGAPV